VRPNPIGTHIVQLIGIEGAYLVVRGLDCIDGTPLIDLKPDRAQFPPLAPRQADDDQIGNTQ
jgi:tRNA (Thr-GGU) A37 N-methylase